jgi:hypothetical protein
MDESDSEDDARLDDLDSSFAHLDVSDETSMSSSHSMDETPKTPQSTEPAFDRAAPKLHSGANGHAKDKAAPAVESLDRTARNSAEFPRAAKSPKNAIPPSLRPLFNHILWRINKEADPEAALESFILLTNDPTKQVAAQKFGVRAKRLEQLRDAIAREDREYRNHLLMKKLETGDTNKQPAAEKSSPAKTENQKPMSDPDDGSDDLDSDEDVVLLKRAPRGPQAQMRAEDTTSNNQQRLFDPNEFARNPQPQSQPQTHASPRGGGARGRGGFNNGFRGRGSPHRGRGGFVPRGGYTPPNPSSSYRPPPAPRHDPTQPIDPDSYSRPPPRVNGTRGARRKLWEPN